MDSRCSVHITIGAIRYCGTQEKREAVKTTFTSCVTLKTKSLSAEKYIHIHTHFIHINFISTKTKYT